MIKETLNRDREKLSKYIDNKKLIKVAGLYVSKNLETNESELIIEIDGLKGRIKSKDLEIKEEANKEINNYIAKTFYVTVSSIDNGYIYCSRKEAQGEILKNKITIGKKLQARIAKINEYGVIVTLYEEMISTFIKKEDLIGEKINIWEIYEVGDNIPVVVNQIRGDKLIVEVIEKYDINRNEYLSNIEEGEIISGYIVRSHVDKNFVRIAPSIDVLCPVEDGYSTDDKVDIEITKVGLENNTLRGRIINLKKINEFMENLEVGKIVNGVVKKIVGNKYYVKINTCIYAKCEINKNHKISIESKVKIKISNIDKKTKEIYGTYIDTKNLNNILDKANKGDIIGGIIKSKTDSNYEVSTNTGLTVLCKIIDDSLQVGDYVFIEIGFVNENTLNIWGAIIDTNKRDKYIQQRTIGEELRGTVIDINGDICIIKVSIGVNMVCPLLKHIKIENDDTVRVKVNEIDTDFSILRGEIIDNITKEQAKVENTEVEDLNDYKRPFVLYGFDKPEFTNQNKKFNKNAIEEMIEYGRISERDKCIVRFLMDSRFASINQIHRFLLTNSNIQCGNIINLKNRIKKLVEYRVINSFRIKGSSMMVYCMDIGGKHILDKEQNKKSKEWTQNNVDKGWNIIGKALVSTEIYVRSKEKYLDSHIEFNASPYIHKDIDSRKSKQVVFIMKLKNKNHKLSILGEVYRADDVAHSFDKRMGNIEEYLASDLWLNEFKEYGRPRVVIVVESEERLLWVTEKLSMSYPNVMKDYIITTDSRLDEDIFNFNY